MFQKNIAAIKLKNPVLADKLEKYSLDNVKDIEVLEAECKDLILSYKKNLLHSAIDPIREAKAVWNRTITREPLKNDIIVVFGLGLGYLFKRAYISCNSKIFLVEPLLDVLRYVLEYVDFSKEFAEDRIYVTDNIQDIISRIESGYLSGDRVEFLFLNSHALLSKDILSELVERTLHVCESKISDQNTIHHLCEAWTRNSVLNMAKFAETRPVGFYENKFLNKPCLLISAGPSLKDNLEKIKKYKDKFVTIAVASAYKVLVEAGINPDFVTYADSVNFAKQVSDVEETLENVNVVMGTRADNEIFKNKTASKLLYFADIDPIAISLQKKFDDKIGLYKSGGTVSILSYYFAKALGCNPVVCVGLDLAFIGNKMYADGRELVSANDGKINAACIGTDAPDFNKNLTYVKDRNGQMIPSRDDYALFIRQFEDICRNEVHPRIVNTSLSGAYVEGMEYIDFEELIKSLELENINVKQILSEVYSSTGDIWNKYSGEAIEELRSLHDKVMEFSAKSKKFAEELQNIIIAVKNKDTSAEALQNFDLIKNETVDLRNEIISNAYVSCYVQTDIWNYTKSYKISPIPDIQEIIFNIEVEQKFFTNINYKCEKMVLWIDQALKNGKTELTAI